MIFGCQIQTNRCEFFQTFTFPFPFFIQYTHIDQGMEHVHVNIISLVI